MPMVPLRLRTSYEGGQGFVHMGAALIRPGTTINVDGGAKIRVTQSGRSLYATFIRSDGISLPAQDISTETTHEIRTHGANEGPPIFKPGQSAQPSKQGHLRRN